MDTGLSKRVANRYARQLLIAAVIPQRWFKTKEAELKALLKEPAGRIDTWADKVEALAPFFLGFRKEFESIAPYHAVQPVWDRVEQARRDLRTVLPPLWDLAHMRGNTHYDEHGGAEKILRHFARWGCLDRVQAAVKTVGDIFKYKWTISEDEIRRIVAKAIARATPEQLVNPSHKLIEKAETKAITKEKHTGWTPVDWVEGTQDMLAAEWAPKPEPQTFMLNGMKIVVSKPDVDDSEVVKYIRSFKEAYGLLKAKDLEAAWYGILHITSREEDDVASGHYNIQGNTVFVHDPPGSRTAYIVLHELGHRYWFKHMSSEQRTRFRSLVKAHVGEKPETVPQRFHPIRLTRREIAVTEREIDRAEAHIRRLVTRIDVSLNLEGLAKDIVAAVNEVEEAIRTLRYKIPDDYLFTEDSLTVHNEYMIPTGRARQAIEGTLEALAKGQDLTTGKSTLDRQIDVYLNASRTALQQLALSSDRQTEQDLAKMPGGEEWLGTYESNPAPVTPVSNYGRTNIDEAFAEVFAHYCLNKDITRDQLESFKTVVKLASRPIKLDKQRFKKLVDDELVPEITRALKRLNRDEPLARRIRLRFERIEINPVGGRGPLPVQIMVESMPTGSDAAVVSGQAVLVTEGVLEGPVVELTLNLNGNLTSEQYLNERLSRALDQQYLYYGLYSVLIHELTHVMEMPFIRERPYAMNEDDTPVDVKEYVNSGIEVRAFMQQIVDEVLIWAKRPIARLHAEGSNQRLVEALLKSSVTWKKVQKWLNATSRKKILSAVYDALDKGGFLLDQEAQVKAARGFINHWREPSLPQSDG